MLKKQENPNRSVRHADPIAETVKTPSDYSAAFVRRGVALDLSATSCNHFGFPGPRFMTDREAAEFIADHAKQLARLARATGLNVLGYILEQAAQEADLVLKGQSNGGVGGVRQH
jgi:hypothetical protein